MYQLPKAFRGLTLDGDAIHQRVRNPEAFKRAVDAPAALRTVLVGSPGSGKTSLAVAIGVEAMRRRDVNGMFVSTMKLDRARREARLGRGDAEEVQRAMDVDVLVVDEFGAEEGASNAVSEIIHERHAEMRQTIVTLSLSMDAIRAQYAGGIVRRLVEGAIRIRCDVGQQLAPSASEVVTLPPRRPHVEPTAPLMACPPELRACLDDALGRIGAPTRKAI